MFKDKVHNIQENEEVQFHQGERDGNLESNFDDDSNCGSTTRLEGFNFSDETIRQGFIRRVYSILVVNFNNLYHPKIY